MLPQQKRTRPVFKAAAIDDQEKFRPLPPPTGFYPYHLDIKKIIPEISSAKMVFHICGDTGGITEVEYNHKVADAMIKQIDAVVNPEDEPKFFFHLGDVVYNFGQADKYYDQFFNAYEHYPLPVFAIPGNHDADVDLLDPTKPNTLDAFIKVFCDTESRTISFARDSSRKSNIQPNVYYTLKTPLADFICLYSNIPRFGTITPEQRDWFIKELTDKTRNRNEKALIVCLHQSAYSADINHGSSIHMQTFLNSAFEETGIYPDVVFSGHVHNYQRFTKQYPGKATVPFIIAGAGGYAQLHSIAKLNDPEYPDTSVLLNDVVLEQSCDDKHGFLKMVIARTESGLNIEGEYYIVSQYDDKNSQPVLFDTFTIKAGNYTT
jgi:predicted phosphodiesterase